jgi:RNA polymerase sigma factor (sigma-70 family)
MARSVDAAFLTEQYRQHANLVFGRCLVMGGGDRAWAEDVTHDVFMRLMEHAAELDRSTSLAPWLLTVAYRLCANRLRHERSVWHRVRAALMSQPETAPERPDLEALPDDPQGAEALGAELRRSLAVLPPKERVAVTMRYLDGASQVQIARALGHSEGYVSKLLARAVSKLREHHWKVDDE